MGVGSSLQNNIKELSLAAMVIVLVSIMLVKFQTTSSVVCRSGLVYNAANELCCGTAASCATNESVLSTSSTLGTFVTAMSEPANWALIIIIVMIATGLFALFKTIKN